MVRGSDKEVELLTIRRAGLQLSTGLGVDGRRKGTGEALLSWKSHSGEWPLPELHCCSIRICSLSC